MNELNELLIFMATAAAGLPDEPHAYAPLRMITAAQKLAEYMLKEDPENETLKAIVSEIEENKGRYATTPEKFYEMLDAVVGLTVDLL